MALSTEDAGDLLRKRGLRSTPQRRAILSAFRGGRDEHLSADEVFARAASSLPDLSRGTVYATLAEFNELGLLGSIGAPEPVRYETNTERHPHFRCRLCIRLFDLATGSQHPSEITDPGFTVERVDTRAEGVCADCNDYASGLTLGARAIRRTGPVTDTLTAAGVAASQTDGPLGDLALAASPQGLIRVAFQDHGDFDVLRLHASSRRGGQAAKRHLAEATEQLSAYFAGDTAGFDCTIDWSFLELAGARTLNSIESIPYATHRSYIELMRERTARDLGFIMGANPIAIVSPCHRVTRGSQMPDTFVGGLARRDWLEGHELATHATEIG